MKKAHLDALEKNRLFDGVYAQIVAGQELMAMRVTFEPGGFAVPHSHPHEQMSIVLQGQVEFTIDGEKKMLEAGDVVSIPGHVVHSAMALKETYLIEVFTPVREDLLERFNMTRL